MAEEVGLLMFGGWMAIHCGWAAFCEYRSGLAEGMFGDYSRNEAPIRFWIVVMMTGSASLMGFAFIALAIVRIYLK